MTSRWTHDRLADAVRESVRSKIASAVSCRQHDVMFNIRSSTSRRATREAILPTDASATPPIGRLADVQFCADSCGTCVGPKGSGFSPFRMDRRYGRSYFFEWMILNSLLTSSLCSTELLAPNALRRRCALRKGGTDF